MVDCTEHILFFEPRSGGHRAEFIQYLLEHIVSEDVRADWKYTFAVSEKLLSSHDRLAHLANGLGNVEFVALEETVSHHWKTCRAMIDRIQPTHLMLMDLTSMELSLCFIRPPCRMSGILFVQYPELRFGDWKQRLKYVTKHLKTGLFLRNQKIHKIFLLNGDFSCDYLNRRFKTSCYLPIPDPVLPGEPSADFDLRKEYGLVTDTRIFLFFGSISARKGADILLESLALVSEKTARESTFLFCGKPEDAYEERFAERFSRLREFRPELKLVADTHFFQTAEMKSAFQQADWILLPYLRPEYSSGILAHAAAVSTPVIAPEGGLIGRLVRESRLGNSTKIKTRALAASIDAACLGHHSYDEELRLAFVQRSDPFDFARMILDGVRNEGY